MVERRRRVRGQIVQDASDALPLREVNVSKLAHAEGEVHGGAAVVDIDLAPGPMHVEEDEQVGQDDRVLRNYSVRLSFCRR